MTEAYIYQVRGEQLLFDLTPLVQSANWSELLDGIGSAQCTLLPGKTADAVLAATDPWLHELHIREDGFTVFQGPVQYVVQPQTSKGSGVIVAKDVAHWLTVRFVHAALNLSGNGNTILPSILNNSLSPTVLPWSQALEPNVLPFVQIHQGTGIQWNGFGRCKVEVPYGHSAPRDFAWAKVSAMFGSEVHMSVHGRRMNFWPFGQFMPGAALSRVDADSFADFPALVKDGDTLATYVSVPARDVQMRYYPAVAGTRLAAGSTSFPAQPWVGYFGGVVGNYDGIDPLSEDRGMFLREIPDSIALGTYISSYPSDIITPSQTQTVVISPGTAGDLGDGYRFVAYDGFSSFKALQPGTNLYVGRLMPYPGLQGWQWNNSPFVVRPLSDTLADMLRRETSLVRSVGSGGAQDLVVELDCNHPWKPQWLVCGAQATISTRLREYTLQVHEVNGEWGGKMSVRLADLGGPPNWSGDASGIPDGFLDRPDDFQDEATPGMFDGPATVDPKAGYPTRTPVPGVVP